MSTQFVIQESDVTHTALKAYRVAGPALDIVAAVGQDGEL